MWLLSLTLFSPSQASWTGPLSIPGIDDLSFEANREMAFSRPLWSFSKVSCRANYVADSLAKWSASNLFFGSIPFRILPAPCWGGCFCLTPWGLPLVFNNTSLLRKIIIINLSESLKKLGDLSAELLQCRENHARCTYEYLKFENACDLACWT